MGVRRDHDEAEEDDTAGALAFVWLLVAFKLATVGIIFYHHQTFETGLILGATTWHWVPLLIPVLSGPILLHYRLRRVRAKREALRRAEWMLDGINAGERATIAE
jgi:hypothetical protein